MSHTSPAQPAAAPLRLLVAEDDNTTRRLITVKLQRAGYALLEATNGEEVLQKASTNRPALVILDIMMPIQDGYSTLRKLKADPGLSNVPVLMLSGKNNEDDVVRCLNAGAADYMVKPFSPDELVVRVRKLLAAPGYAAPA